MHALGRLLTCRHAFSVHQPAGMKPYKRPYEPSLWDKLSVRPLGFHERLGTALPQAYAPVDMLCVFSHARLIGFLNLLFCVVQCGMYMYTVDVQISRCCTMSYVCSIQGASIECHLHRLC